MKKDLLCQEKFDHKTCGVVSMTEKGIGKRRVSKKVPSALLRAGFDALEWLAAMGLHVPNKAEQRVRYYGYYSNVSRGKKGKLNPDGAIP